MSASDQGYMKAVNFARDRAAAVKAEQDATAGAMVTGAVAVFAVTSQTPLPGPADVFLSLLLGCAPMGFAAGFVEGPVGDGARSIGAGVSSVAGKGAELASPLTDKVKESMPGGDGKGLSMDDIKKYGIAGTLSYILTELAFWAVAFPVASTTFYNTAGHWPDFSDGGDRTTVLAFIFAGANVARLVVPLRFGVAFALAPWVDENIVQKFGIGGGDDGEKEA